MGKNTKYYEVDQLNLNATSHRLPPAPKPRWLMDDKEKRSDTLWGWVAGAIAFGPIIYYLIF